MTVERQGLVTTVSVIALPYAAVVAGWLSWDSETAAPARIGVVTALWLTYFVLMVLLTEEYLVLRTLGVRLGVMAALSVLAVSASALVTPGIMWIITMPIVAVAEETLPAAWRRPFYVVAPAAAALPFWLEQGVGSAAASLSFAIPATAFVVFFTRLALTAESGRRRAEGLTRALEDANRRLGEYAVQAEELAMTQERNRIAREIHDNLGHYLTVVNVQIEAARLLLTRDPDRAQAALEKAQRLTQEGLHAVRRSVSALRADPATERPTPEAIGDLVSAVRAAGLETDYEVRGSARPTSPQVTLTLYRAAQEALTNVQRHAGARRVDVVLDYTAPDAIALSVIDDGRGTDGASDGFGLLGLRERVALLGGSVTIETAPGRGFALHLRVQDAKGDA